MTRAALKGLLQRKLRALLTAMSVVLGVAMVSGTFMLTDSIQGAFDTIFESSYSETDAVVSGKPIVEGASSGNPTVSADVLARVRELPGVEAAAGSLQDLQTTSNNTKLIGSDGEPVTTGDSPTFGVGVDPTYPRFTPLELTEGDWARGPGQVVVDAGTAKAEDFSVGDTIGVSASGPVEQFRITGIARFGDVDSLAGATIAAFDLPTAQRILRKDGFDSISVAARKGTSVEALMAQIRPVLPATAQVESASARAAGDSKEVDEFVGYLRYALLAFGGIALFVGGFVIFNTLAITVAQRTREFATLRTIGASRRQVLRSVILETLVIGIVASLLGLGLGFVLADQLSALFGALGLGLPEAGTVVAERTVFVSLAVGVLITLLAGLVPAVRATRVPPIAAVREGSSLPATRLSRARERAGARRAGRRRRRARPRPVRVGTCRRSSAAGDRVGLARRLHRRGDGLAAACTPLAAFVGAPAQRLGGTAGACARNAVRNPGRTAATAAALMIGLTLVTTVAVLGQGLRTSAKETVERQVLADYVVTSENGFDACRPLWAARSRPPCRRGGERPQREGQGVRLHDDRHGRRGEIAALHRFRFSTERRPVASSAGAARSSAGLSPRITWRWETSLRVVAPAGETLGLRVRHPRPGLTRPRPAAGYRDDLAGELRPHFSAAAGPLHVRERAVARALASQALSRAWRGSPGRERPVPSSSPNAPQGSLRSSTCSTSCSRSPW